MARRYTRAERRSYRAGFKAGYFAGAKDAFDRYGKVR